MNRLKVGIFLLIGMIIFNVGWYEQIDALRLLGTVMLLIAGVAACMVVYRKKDK